MDDIVRLNPAVAASGKGRGIGTLKLVEGRVWRVGGVEKAADLNDIVRLNDVVAAGSRSDIGSKPRTPGVEGEKFQKPEVAVPQSRPGGRFPRFIKLQERVGFLQR